MSDFKIGAIYYVSTQRKGCFCFKPTSQDEIFVTGIVVTGKAEAMLAYNERYPGEEVTLRKSFINNKKLIDKTEAKS